MLMLTITILAPTISVDTPTCHVRNAEFQAEISWQYSCSRAVRAWCALLAKYARYGVTAAWVIAGGWLAGATAERCGHAGWSCRRRRKSSATSLSATPRTMRAGTRRSASCCSATNSGGASTRLMPSRRRRQRPHFTDEMKAVLNSRQRNHLRRRELGRNSARHARSRHGRAQEERRAAPPRRKNRRLGARSAQQADPGPQAERRPSHADRHVTTPPINAAS